MGTSAISSIGQDPKLNQWYTLQGKFKSAYPVEKTEGIQKTPYVEEPTSGVTESASNVNIKSPVYASGLAYDGFYDPQVGGIAGAKFDSNRYFG